MPAVLPITLGVFLGLSVIAVGLRWYARLFILRRVGFEDSLITASLLSSVAWFVSHAFACKHGFGQDVTDLSREDTVILLKAVWLGPAFWGLSAALCKLSILWQYRRVFPGERVRHVCLAIMFCVILHGLFSFFGSLFRCTPIKSMWDPDMSGAKCLDWFTFNYILVGSNIALDVVIFTMPIPLVWRMEIPKEQKRALIFVFTFGILVVIASIMRLVQLQHRDVAEHDSGTDSDGLVGMAIWSGIEMNTSIICACLAVLKPLVAKIFPKWFQTIASMNSTTKSVTASSTTNGSRPYSVESQDFAKTTKSARSSTQDIEVDVAVEMLSERTSRKNSQACLNGTPATECFYGHNCTQGCRPTESVDV